MCDHYVCGARVLPACCGTTFDCWRCHDDVQDHRIDRAASSLQFVCVGCSVAQPPAQSCRECSASFGTHYCDECHLICTRPEPIFHCALCASCMVGRREDYHHCPTCNICIRPDLPHACVSDQQSATCICLERMHASQKPSRLLSCGHLLHAECANALRDNRCPFCRAPLGASPAPAHLTEWRVALHEMITECVERLNHGEMPVEPTWPDHWTPEQKTEASLHFASAMHNAFAHLM